MRTLLLGIIIGLCAGIVFAAGGGVWLVAGLVCLVFLMVTMDSPALAVSTMILVLPLFGRIAVVSLPAVPDVTVGRVVVLWSIVVVGMALRLQESTSDPFALKEPRRYLIRKALPAWVAVFLGFMLFAGLRSPSPSAGLQGWLDEYLLPFAAFLVFSRYEWSRRRSDQVITAYLACCCLWSALALVEFVTKRSVFAGNGVLPWASPGAPFGRTGGPFINPAFLGTALGIGLVLAWLWSGRDGRLRHLALASMPMCALGLVASLDRGSWLGAAAGMIVVLALTLRHRLTAVAVSVAAMALGVVLVASVLGVGFLEARTTSTSEVYNRIAIQGAAVRIIVDNPLIGVGSDRFDLLARQNLHDVGAVSAAFGLGVAVPHNSILDATVDGGLGAGAALIVVFGLLIAAARTRLAPLSSRHLGVGALASIVVFAVNAMVVDMSLGTAVSTLALSIIAVLVSTSDEQEQVDQ